MNNSSRLVSRRQLWLLVAEIHDPTSTRVESRIVAGVAGANHTCDAQLAVRADGTMTPVVAMNGNDHAAALSAVLAFLE